MEDIWVQRIKAIGVAVALIISSVGGIVAAWQSVNNNTVMKTNHAEWKASQQRTMTQEK